MAQILLTEDDEAVRSFVKRALELDGHAVETAEDGLIALEILEDMRGEFDLLLSDIMMPGMDGIELTYKVAESWPEMTILLMTGYAQQRERAGELMQRVHDVVSKPFSLAEIRSAVGAAIEARQAA